MYSKDKIKDIVFSENTGLYMACIGIIIIFLSILLFIICGSWNFSSVLDESKIGQFGDFVGGFVGSLFALIGVILYYVALKEQRKDIQINRDALKLQIDALKQQVKEFKAQKEELIETRKVYEEQTKLFREQTEYFKQQAKEYKSQTSTNALQQFDSSFYSLLHLLLDIHQELKSIDPFYFASIYSQLSIDISKYNMCQACEKVNGKYIEIYYKHSDELSRCFKTLYRILRYIDSSSFDKSTKEHYAKILRSQLSDNELLVLYYNCHSDLGKKAREIVMKYDLLKHINQLDKIELGCCNIPNKEKIWQYFRTINEIIKNNFNKYNDIEQTEPINICEDFSFVEINSSFHLIINEELFSFSVLFTLDCWNQVNEIYQENIVTRLFAGQLYDLFFLSKFRIPKGNELEVFKIMSKNQNTIEFKFYTNQIDKIF